jgi:hypothetical protein
MSEVANYSEMSTEELEALLEKKKKAEKRELEKKRTDYEKEKDNLVFMLSAKAFEINEELVDFKEIATERLNDFYGLLKKYGDVRNSNKGTFEITNKEGDLKVQYNHNKTFGFNEKGAIAAEKLKEWLSLFVKKADKDLHDFFISLLDKNAKDEYDPRNINKIYKYENRGGKFDHELFQGSVKLFKEAYVEKESSYYIRFYKKDEEGKWHSINLNWSSI